MKNKMRERVRRLRALGNTYREITEKLKIKTSKSVLSYWCKDVEMPPSYADKVERIIKLNIARSRHLALATNKKRRKEYLNTLYDKNKNLVELLDNATTAKALLAVLYLGEGSKTRKGCLTFGNSSAPIIRLFLRLLKKVYGLDKNKFRCTIQCRADQDKGALEKFWSSVTKISPAQFYATRVDPRTIGKKTKKSNYKGVCRIDYFSANIYNELMAVGNLLSKD